MSHPWWKMAPTPTPSSRPGTGAGAEVVPWFPEPPRTFPASRIKCSAPGCSFQSGEISTASLGTGLKAFCEYHATGHELTSRELFWKLPCACGKAASGFSSTRAGVIERHSEDKCLEQPLESNAAVH